MSTEIFDRFDKLIEIIGEIPCLKENEIFKKFFVAEGGKVSRLRLLYDGFNNISSLPTKSITDPQFYN